MSIVKQIDVSEHLAVWGFGDRVEPFDNPIHIELVGAAGRAVQLSIKMDIEQAKLMARSLGAAIQAVENELAGQPGLDLEAGDEGGAA